MSNRSLTIKELRKKNPEKATPTRDAGSLWNFLNKEISFSGNGLSDSIKESFYLELSILLEAGVDIKTSLELIGEKHSKKKHKLIFLKIKEEVMEGSSLSAALERSNRFTPYEYYSLKIGEETGKLAMVLNDMASFFQKKIKQQRQIISALTYPVVVLLVAVAAVAFMMVFVVPMFADILKRFGGDLPAITRLVLVLSAALMNSGWVILLIVTGVFIMVMMNRRKEWFRRLYGSCLLRIPFMGDMVHKIYLARFANTISLLIASRVPILQAIELVSKMIRFYPLERTFGMITRDITAGMPLYKSMSLHSIYPSKMVLLLRVGEEVNQLDVFFRKISDQYNNEVEHQMNILSKLVEPVIIIVLGLVVGIILVAMYLPLFKMGQSF